MPDLSGHVAIISGGLGDIGQAIATELARQGADIALGDVRPEPDANAVLEEIRHTGRKVRYDRVDVADAESVRQWMEAVEGDLGVPDLIIPNAAIVTIADIRTVTPEEWRREIQVNLDGSFHLAQAGALRLLHHRRPGRIVFIGSWAAHAPHPQIIAYSVAKAGLRMLCQCMAKDLAPRGILVNEVAPGYVDAGLSGRIFEEHPEQREAALSRVPVRALIQPEEVAAQVAYLCDFNQKHITGSVLLMDGGLSLGPLGGQPDE